MSARSSLVSSGQPSGFADLQNSSSWSNGARHHHLRRKRRSLGSSRTPRQGVSGDPARRSLPAIVISPFAKRGSVDNTEYETVSIDKTLEDRYHLPALSTRNAAANPMYNSYTFSPTDIVRNN